MNLAARHQKQSPSQSEIVNKMSEHADILSLQLGQLREQMFPPKAQKVLRQFMMTEVTSLLGPSESTLRQMDLDNKGPSPHRLDNGRRVYTLAQINELRRYLAENKPKEAVRFLPHRRGDEHLQILSIVNFKGGSAKTTTTLHLSHFLALQGYRVLVVDLDPQASLSAMFGEQPEIDVGANETIYGAIRYDDDRVPIQNVIRKTYFDGIDIIPGNLEVVEFDYFTPLVVNQMSGNKAEFIAQRLSEAISQVESDYDIVLLDTPPALGYLSLNAIFAATGMLITVHPAMIDISSMHQLMLMMRDLVGELERGGATLNLDFFKYIITRHDPNDHAQSAMVGFMKLYLGDNVLNSTALQSTAVETAGVGKRSIYEVESGEINRNTLKRSRDSMDALNHEILKYIEISWGRGNG